LPASHRERFLEDLRTLHDTLLAADGTAVTKENWESHFPR